MRQRLALTFCNHSMSLADAYLLQAGDTYNTREITIAENPFWITAGGKPCFLTDYINNVPTNTHIFLQPYP